MVAMSLQKLLPALLGCLLLSAPATAQDPLESIAAALENRQMQRLADRQNEPGARIKPFDTDGCSGGMSETWEYLAKTLPEFTRYIGDKPPWEHCCVTHDRDYWQGDTEAGYTKRQLSDAQLRDCVQRTGRDQADMIAENLNIPRAEVIRLVDLTSELMYLAVRIGGGPCSGLPWRWGHGWPTCATPDDLKPSPPVKAVQRQHDYRHG